MAALSNVGDLLWTFTTRLKRGAPFFFFFFPFFCFFFFFFVFFVFFSIASTCLTISYYRPIHRADLCSTEHVQSSGRGNVTAVKMMFLLLFRCCTTHPGAVIHLSDCPIDPSKVIGLFLFLATASQWAVALAVTWLGFTNSGSHCSKPLELERWEKETDATCFCLHSVKWYSWGWIGVTVFDFKWGVETWPRVIVYILWSLLSVTLKNPLVVFRSKCWLC